MKTPLLALVGDRDPGKTAHQGIEASLALQQKIDPSFNYAWVSTASITQDSFPPGLRDATGIWCVPGSPYASTEGALLAIRFARTERKAFLGTCGGFQHALIEYAQNVLGRPADHQEIAPAADTPLIAKLSCSLVGASGIVRVTTPDLFAGVLGARETTEEFNCNYGFNDELAGIFANSDLAFVAHDEAGQVRAFRLKSHPFFIGTLFQPERRALGGSLHPVVNAFFQAVSAPAADHAPSGPGERSMAPFLVATEIIDSTNPAIIAAAAEIVGDAADDEEIARRCFEWVRDDVRHSSDYQLPVVTCTASDVLKHRAGFCYAKSHLLAALLRARGIPAALCYQRLAYDDSGSGFFLHGLVAIHLQRYGWYRVDPRGDKPGISSGFHPPVEQLPYTPKLAGEMNIPGRFPDAIGCVVNTLRQSATAADVRANLPDYLPNTR